MFVYSYLQSAKNILESYKGNEPFSAFIKKYFAANKKFGSKDRKRIAHLCYCFFRLGKWNIEGDIEERIQAGVFLCSSENEELAIAMLPGWKDKLQLSLEDKIAFLKSELGINVDEIFPWQHELSNEIDHQ